MNYNIMSKLDDKLQEINSAIYNDSKFRKKLEKKIESHPDVRLFEIMHGTGSYLIYFKTGAFSNIIGNLFDVECFASPGWESEHDEGIGIEPSLHRAGWNRKEEKHIGKEAKIFDEIFTRKNAIYMYTEDMVDIISFVDEMNHDLIVPVNRKRIEKIDSIDDYINWYYSKIDGIKKRTGKAIKEAIASMDNEMSASFEKAYKNAFAKGGELMDADTEFEYGKGAKLQRCGLTEKSLFSFRDFLLRKKKFLEVGLKREGGLSVQDNTWAQYSLLDDILDSLEFYSYDDYDRKKLAKGGKLMDADTEFEYAKGGILTKSAISYIGDQLASEIEDRLDLIELATNVLYDNDEGVYSSGRGYMDEEDVKRMDDQYKDVKRIIGDALNKLSFQYDREDYDQGYAKGGNVNNKVDTISNWVMFCYNYPSNFMDAFGEKDNPMRKHLTTKFESFYDRVGPGEVMNKFYVNLDNKNRTKLINWVNLNYKGQ